MRMDIGIWPEIGTRGFLAGGLLPGAGLRTGPCAAGRSRGSGRQDAIRHREEKRNESIRIPAHREVPDPFHDDCLCAGDPRRRLERELGSA